MKLIHLVAAVLPLALMACLDSTTAPSTTPGSVNNSDISKSNYVAPTPADASRREDAISRKRQGFRHFNTDTLAKSGLEKSSSIFYVGYLDGGFGTENCTDVLTIHMDDENTGNQSQLYTRGWVRSGWPPFYTWTWTNWGAETDYAIPGVTQPGGVDTRFRLCRRTVTSLPAGSFDYAVVALDDGCPPGSYMFSKGWDNEDDNNGNWASNTWGSGSSNSDITEIAFCFVPQATSGGINPMLPNGAGAASPGGVFADITDGSQGSMCSAGWMITDDEDTDNSNFWVGPSTYAARMKALVSDGPNTHLLFGWCHPVTTGI